MLKSNCDIMNRNGFYCIQSEGEFIFVKWFYQTHKTELYFF